MSLKLGLSHWRKNIDCGCVETGCWGEYLDLRGRKWRENLCASPSIIRVNKSSRLIWAGCITRMGEIRNIYKIMAGKSEGKRPLGRPRCRWNDNIKLDLRRDKVGSCGLGSFGLEQGPMTSSCERGNEPWLAEWLLASQERLCSMGLIIPIRITTTLAEVGYYDKTKKKEGGKVLRLTLFIVKLFLQKKFPAYV